MARKDAEQREHRARRAVEIDSRTNILFEVLPREAAHWARKLISHGVFTRNVGAFVGAVWAAQSGRRRIGSATP